MRFKPVLAVTAILCTAGAARYRDFRSYACVLSGYTAALIGIPATLHPDAAFMQAVWRLLEVCLGILCATVVSAAIFPQSAGAAMRNALYLRFGAFAGFVLDHLDGGDPAAFEAASVSFAAQAVGLDTLRSASTFEDPHMRLRNGRLLRLNNEFMVLGTRYHALHQLLARLRGQGADEVLEAFAPCLDELRRVLQPWRGRASAEFRIDQHRWNVFDRASGAKLGSFRSVVSAAPFVVVGRTLYYTSPPHQMRRGDKMLRRGTMLRAVDLGAGTEAWTKAVRDPAFHGPFPP